MKNIFLIFLLPSFLLTQVTFSEHISPIIYNNCTECHRVGGPGPMPFTNYNEVSSLGYMIEYVTSTGYMPPWHADPEYSNFVGERFLNDQDKQLISDWVNEGMLQGDPNLEAIIPEFPEGSQIGIPDAVFTMEEEYLIEGNNQDDYRVFVFETNFNEDKYLKSIEIIPGNLSAVHHVIINIDTQGLCAQLDAQTTEYGYECESGFCVPGVPQFAAGYTPGMTPPVWNNDIGMVLPQGSDIAIQIHYAPSSIDEYDQTSVNLFFKEQPVEREVEVLTLLDTELQIPANEIYTHYMSYEVPFDMSIISVLPHMHLIGKSWLIYAENDGDTIPIISIPQWDFNWQSFYQPQFLLKLPQGYTLHAYATYDNTSSNPFNPNSPPQNMYWCDYTTCEMFFLPFAFVPYEEGDENTYLGNSDDLGCTDAYACNFNQDAIIDDGSCGVFDDCGYCHVPCCYNEITQECDYSVNEQNCNNFWADYDVISDSSQNIFWNDSCLSGCTDSNACNYDSSILPGGFDDGSCEYPPDFYNCDGECINDNNFNGICDEEECFDIICEEYYNCISGECICLNDVNDNQICDEFELEDCSLLSIDLIYQSSVNEIAVNVSNSDFANFPYPGFILFNSFGDTIAVENVNFFGIPNTSSHILTIQDNAELTSVVSLHLYTGFYDLFQCEWSDLIITDNCDLTPDEGECDGAFQVFYFDQTTSSCQETIWGGCGGIVPFTTFEDCESSCNVFNINNNIKSDKEIIFRFDVLGKKSNLNSKYIIEVFDDGTVDKKIILN